MQLSKGNLSRAAKWVLLGLLGLPLLIVVGKSAILPTSDLFGRLFSLADIAAGIETRLDYLLFVPLGAMFVVFFRLTLGIRLLGPFRSILLAVAFQITGIAFGLIFVTLVIGVIALIRPFLKEMKLPYFGRVSVILGAVSGIMVIVLLASNWFEAEPLRRTAYFPIVVLCLAGEAFARTLTREGMGSAMWRGAMTVLVAVVITLCTMIPGLADLLVRYPELLILQIGLIVVIAEFFDLRLLQSLNPPVEKKRSRRKRRKASRRRANATSARR